MRMSVTWRFIGIGVLLVLVLLPAAALAFYKPVRVLFPQLNGVQCEGSLCLDDWGQAPRARGLYEQARVDVEERVGAFRETPRVIFCSTRACYESFGFHRSAAQTVSTLGMVIAPRGWTPYYLRHEMVHHWQAERLGGLQMWRGPEWLIEGMAYSLSDDPRAQLSEPFESYRRRFDAWYGGQKGDALEAALRTELAAD